MSSTKISHYFSSQISASMAQKRKEKEIETERDTNIEILLPAPSPKNVKRNYDENMQELAEKGYTVIKNVVSLEKCEIYYQQIWKWLASLETGISLEDKNTWKTTNWPISIHGILQHYAVGQEQFVWDVRCQEEIIDVFEAIWGTRKLLVSFDGLNISKPGKSTHGNKWYHTDQKSGRLESPKGAGFKMHKSLTEAKCYCIQGSLNLLPNGPSDGGLAVLERSHKIHENFFSANPQAKAKVKSNWYKLEDEDYAFFNDCKEVKVCCDPGDILLWDSRAMHMAYKPQGDLFRSVIYVCYMPVDMASYSDVEKKKKAFYAKRMTSHWPCEPRLFSKNPRTYGKDTSKYIVSDTLPVLNDVGKRLAGIAPY